MPKERRRKGVAHLKELPPLFQKLYIKNLEKQHKSVYISLFDRKYHDRSAFINALHWVETDEGWDFWYAVDTNRIKEAFDIYKKSKTEQHANA